MDKEFYWEQQNKEEPKNEDYNIFDVQEYDIINTSIYEPVNIRKSKLTWNEYFNKLYNITLIILISTVIYFYYVYGKTTKKTNQDN